MKSQITGTWKLKSFESRSEDGDIFYPFGENPKGFLMYDISGYMSGMISRGDRSNLSVKNFNNMDESEKASLSDGFIGYSGKYEILDDKIIHHVEISFIPNWIGKPLDRFYQFENDDLVLTTSPERFNNKKFVHYIVWKKL
ncbi:lipocalin-like domain-containing protein [Methanobacterium sp.]|uniref:lipocalin-like domain-containing protein n=1 Tax=Methanobacterium sp. TaxID=2164 RepID=UPI003C7937DF